MSLYTHWVCFDCRKSFHNLPARDSVARQQRTCPECGEEMRDMGVYFEPPRRQARKAWAVARLLAEGGYRFQTEGDVSHIRDHIMGAKRPRLEDVRQNIEARKRRT